MRYNTLYNTLPIPKLFQFQILLHAHAVYFRLPTLPDIFVSNYHLNSEIHMHNTRSSQDFHRISFISTYNSKISSNLCAKYWNQLPLNFKTLSNPKIFKKQLKEYLSSNEL